MARKQRTIAALIHGYKWDFPRSDIEIAPGIALCRMTETPIEVCYQRLCEVQGTDDGEPYYYEVCILLKLPPVEWSYDLYEEFATLNRLCNLITIVAGSSVGRCQMMFSTNDFATLPETELAFGFGIQTEYFDSTWASITSEVAEDVVSAWRNVQGLWGDSHGKSRLANALLFFHSAWRSPSEEHLCLNLAICLEILFAPHSNSETTHQIAFNLSRFVGGSPKQREQVFRLCKRFYAVRSAIVHGGLPEVGKVVDVTRKMLPVVAATLRRIIINTELARTFDDNQARAGMLNSYLFE